MVLVPTGDEFPIVNFELVGTATLSRPCGVLDEQGSVDNMDA